MLQACGLLARAPDDGVAFGAIGGLTGAVTLYLEGSWVYGPPTTVTS